MIEQGVQAVSSHDEQSLQTARLQEHDLRRMALRRQQAEFGVLTDLEVAVIRAMRTTLARVVERPEDDGVEPGTHFEGDFGGRDA